jgi:hypothetical protein
LRDWILLWIFVIIFEFGDIAGCEKGSPPKVFCKEKMRFTENKIRKKMVPPVAIRFEIFLALLLKT